MTISNITSRFRTTGICPFDIDTLPVEAIAPSLPTYRLEVVNEEVDSAYDADDYLPLETLRDLLKNKSASRRKAWSYKAIDVKRDVFSAKQSPKFCNNSSQPCSSISQKQKPKPYTAEEKWEPLLHRVHRPYGYFRSKSFVRVWYETRSTYTLYAAYVCAIVCAVIALYIELTCILSSSRADDLYATYCELCIMNANKREMNVLFPAAMDDR
ncbi:hypothetical protein Trydic_g21126 [Trypoxylus dichotomus]